jgi:hypothetical protein
MTLFIARWTLGWPKEALAVAEIYIKFMALEKVKGATTIYWIRHDRARSETYLL